jgi:rRNA processing protein Krr1/Pno1
MLVVAKKPRINLKLEGQGIRKVITLIKKNFNDVEVKKDDDDEVVLIENTEWYKKVSKGLTPAKALKVYRNNANLTMMELSEKCGIAQSHLSDMETGKRNIGKISAQKLGKALNCNYRRFL